MGFELNVRTKYGTIKVLKDLPGASAGRRVKVEVDNAGTPISAFWRRRLLDAKIDGCCELVEVKEAKEEKKVTKESKKVTETKGAN